MVAAAAILVVLPFEAVLSVMIGHDRVRFR